MRKSIYKEEWPASRMVLPLVRESLWTACGRDSVASATVETLIITFWRYYSAICVTNLKIDKVRRAVYADDTFVTSFERESRDLAPCVQRIGKKRGLAITLTRAIIASPHTHEEESSWSL
jgi:hypothetical protein